METLTLISILTDAYFAGNIFLCGAYYNDSKTGDDSKVHQRLTLSFLLLFGTLFYLVARLVDLAKVISSYFCLYFFFNFYFRGAFRDLSIAQLYQTNVLSQTATYFFRKSTVLINKVNGYRFDEINSRVEKKMWSRLDMADLPYNANKAEFNKKQPVEWLKNPENYHSLYS